MLCNVDLLGGEEPLPGNIEVTAYWTAEKLFVCLNVDGFTVARLSAPVDASIGSVIGQVGCDFATGWPKHIRGDGSAGS
jgi:hypothetical protein